MREGEQGDESRTMVTYILGGVACVHLGLESRMGMREQVEVSGGEGRS